MDPGDLPGLGVLRQMRELRTLGPYIRSTGRLQAQAEVTPPHRRPKERDGT